MIVWCRECDENWLQINGDWKDECPCKYPHQYYKTSWPKITLEDLAALQGKFWAQRTLRIEFNTVDLTELSRERRRRRQLQFEH